MSCFSDLETSLCIQHGGSEFEKKPTFEVRGFIAKEKILAKETECNKRLIPGWHAALTVAKLWVYKEIFKVFLTSILWAVTVSKDSFPWHKDTVSCWQLRSSELSWVQVSRGLEKISGLRGDSSKPRVRRYSRDGAVSRWLLTTSLLTKAQTKQMA